jgi:CLIP-associating protein 1/2
VLTAGPIANASNRVAPSDEDGRSSGKAASGDALTSDTAAWEEGGLFVALLEGVQRYVPTRASETRSNADVEVSALAVLNRLVEHQYPVLCSTATERSLLDTLLGALDTLCGASVSHSSAVVAHKTILAAWESVLSTWAGRCDAVLGFDLLLPHALDAAIVPVLRSGYTPLLLRLPAQLVLEDFLPRLRGVIVQALRGDKAEQRLAATTMLKRLNDAARPHVADSHTRIFSALQLGDSDRALLDVLMYYFSKP